MRFCILHERFETSLLSKDDMAFPECCKLYQGAKER